MNVRPISKELQEKAIAELNEDPNRIKDDIEYIKNWLSKQPHLIARTDDQWILSFLRGCKFSLERTKEKLDMYYTVRTIAPEFYEGRDPFNPQIQELLNAGLVLPLKKTVGPDTPRVLLLRMDADSAKFNVNNIMKLNSMISEILVKDDDQYLIAGFVALQDMKGVTMAHMTQMSPALMKKSMTIFQEAMPVRPKMMHYINIPSFFETLYNMMKAFIKEKLQKRMVIHTSDNMDTVYEHIPKDILPKEYGGTDGTIAELTAYWKKKVESYSDWFKEDEKYRSIESKRLGKPKTGDDVFGLEGSFRKLNVD